MTLLSICQAACNSVPVAAPTSIVGNTSDEGALALLAYANEAGQSLSRRAPGGWTNMIREYDLTTVAIVSQTGTVANVGGVAVVTMPTQQSGVTTKAWYISGTYIPNNAVITAIAAGSGSTYLYTLNLPASSTGAGTFTFSKSDYPLPSDFARTVDNTFWDRTRYWAMRGVQSPQQWQAYKSSIFSKATVERRYRFRDSDWLSSSTGTPSTAVFSIDPVPVDNGANLVFEYVSNGWCANASTGARQTQWLADTDYGVVDEWLMTLGIKWRLLRRMGVSYSEELAEYEDEVDKAVARDGGTAVLNMTPTRGYLLGPLTNVQEGSFPS